MLSLYQSDLAGYGIFSLQGLSVLAACLLLMVAVHPATLFAARMGDLVQRWSTSWKSDSSTRHRGLDTSSFSVFGSGFLLRGEARVTAYALFAMVVANQVFDTNAVLFGAIDIGDVAGYVAYISIGLFALTGIVDSLKLSWSTLSGTRFSGLLNLAAFTALAVGIYFAREDPTWILSAIALSFAARVVTLIAVRGLSFGLGSLIWCPMMISIWFIMTCVVSIVGPFVRIFDKVVESPGFNGVPFGLKREEEIRTAEISIPRCFALDGVVGAISPR